VKPVPFTSYRLKNGTQIYRTNASNLSLGRKQHVTGEQHRQRDYQFTQSMRNQYIDGQRTTELKSKKEIDSLKRRIDELEEENESLEEEVDRLQTKLARIRTNMSWGQWFRSFFA
jgi:predicted RNase H-like nuclease (RuvC/YqgF family)